MILSVFGIDTNRYLVLIQLAKCHNTCGRCDDERSCKDSANNCEWDKKSATCESKTDKPTLEPTPEPTDRPSPQPTPEPTNRPIIINSSFLPTDDPTFDPTPEPTKRPTTSSPTKVKYIGDYEDDTNSPYWKKSPGPGDVQINIHFGDDHEDQIKEKEYY